MSNPVTSEAVMVFSALEKIVDFNCFLDLSDFIETVWGSEVGGGGPKLLSGDFFESFRGFGVLAL